MIEDIISREPLLRYIVGWFFYIIIPAFHLWIAEFVFCMGFRRRDKFWLRFTKGCLVTIVFLGLLEAVLFFGGENILTYVVVYSSIFTISVWSVWNSCEERFYKVFLCCTGAYCLQNMVSRVMQIIFICWPIYGLKDVLIQQCLYLLLMIIIYMGMNVGLIKRIRQIVSVNLESFHTRLFIILALFITILMSSACDIYLSDAMGGIIGALLSIFCCLFLLLEMLLVLDMKKMQEEQAITEAIRRKEKEQMEFSKENIHLINIKCHDLKHQIRNMRKGNISEEALAEIEKAVLLYDSALQTNNEAIDTILAEKALFFQEHEIQFSCMLDGSRYDFMQLTDIYSLFGNAIENAIEAVMQLPREERVISVTEQLMGNNTVLLQFMNPYSGIINFENGIPVTSKEDNRYHGYGIHSMKQITKKYGGELFIESEKQVYRLNIILPLS